MAFDGSIECIYLKFVFLDFPPQLRCFTDSVQARLVDAYRPSTHLAHHTAVVGLASFCVYCTLIFQMFMWPKCYVFYVQSFKWLLNFQYQLLKIT
jgi:hypothetical protein